MGSGGDDLQLAELQRALPLSCMTPGELWMKYFALGGSVGQFELEAFLGAAHHLPALERDLLAQAFNEHFMEMPLDVRVRYSAGGV